MRTTGLLLQLLAVLLCTVEGRAQSAEQWVAWGDASMEQEEYYGASRFYAGALQLEPGRMHLQWKQAEACRLSNQYPQALELYERVYRKDAGRTYPEALRWLGEMELCDGRYADAKETWTKVLQRTKDKGSALAQRARNALEGCQLAGEVRSAEYEVSHLPAPVNTVASEFGARIGPDRTLWFTSLRGEVNADYEVVDTAAYKPHIFSTEPSAQGWNEPMQEAGPPDALGRSNANLMWTANDTRIYFTMIDADGTKRIATRTATGPAQVMIGLDAHPDATQPWAVEVEGTQVLFFVAQGGLGGTDIWYGQLNEAVVSDIRNAGEGVNSPGDESTPSFDAATSTLWFSSAYHAGLGGFDIFTSTWNKGRFDLPKNMTALNSPANDLYPTYDHTTGEGWLTSNRKGSFAAKGETCCNDIYFFRSTNERPMQPPVADTTNTISTVPPVQALIALQADFPLKLYFHNDEPEPRTRSTATNKTYEQTLTNYRVLFPDYFQRNADTLRIARFFAEEVEAGSTKLEALVHALLPVLASGQRVTLDVRGHASPLAQNDYNRDLSLRRIESLRNHLAWAQSGALKPFMDSTATNGGILRIRVLPFGEDRSVEGVSDDVKDLDHSVYSVSAARERRIEVERVGVASAPPPHEWRFDIGDVRMGEPHSFTVPMTNTGDVPLKVIKARSSCECVLVENVPDEIPAGATAELELFFSGRARPGALHRIITLETDGTPPTRELTIHGNVLE